MLPLNSSPMPTDTAGRLLAEVKGLVIFIENSLSPFQDIKQLHRWYFICLKVREICISSNKTLEVCGVAKSRK